MSRSLCVPERTMDMIAFAPATASTPPATGSAAQHDPGWQTAAWAFVRRCSDALQTSTEAQAYLGKRGLPLAWCNAQTLGWNDRERRETWGSTPVYLARGVVIPWRAGDRLLKVNIRRLQGDPKYLQAAGGMNGLYDGDLLDLGTTAVLVEGELDAVSVWAGAGAYCIRNSVIAVATGSATGGRNRASLLRLMATDQVLLAFDDDEAGDHAAAWWQARLQRKGVRLRPTRHDVNAMLVAGEDIEAWLAAGIGAAF